MELRMGVLITLVWFSCFTLANAEGTESSSDSKTVALRLNYPTEELERNNEGWTLIGFMINTEGHIFEPFIELSSGSTYFEQEALKAIEKLRFKPVSRKGKLIEIRHNYKITFQTGVGRNSITPYSPSYKEILAAIGEGKLDEASTRIAELKGANNLTIKDVSVISLLEAQLAGANNDLFGQLYGLQRATGTPITNSQSSVADLLPNEYGRIAMLQLLDIQIDLQMFPEALFTFEALKKMKNSSEDILKAQPFIDQINEFKASGKALAITGTISTTKDWQRVLMRSKFYFEAVQGSLKSLKLRCKLGYREFSYQADMAFELPDGWDDCHLQLFGEEGTSFRLVQY